MQDSRKNKTQLIKELAELKRKFSDFEKKDCLKSRNQHRMLEIAVEQSIDGIAVADIDGFIQYINLSWLQMHGFQEEDVIGKHLSIFHTNEQLENEVIPFNNEVKKTGAKLGEIGHVRKDGSTFSSLMTSSLLKDFNGKVIGFIGIARDISEIKKTEITLRISEEKLQATLGSLSDLVFIFNKDGIFEDFHKPVDFPELFIPPERFIGKHYKDILPSYVSELFKKAFKEIIKTNVTQQFDYPLLMNNKEMWYCARGSIRQGKNGELSGVTAIVRDITQKKQAEEDLKASVEKYHGIFDDSVAAIYIFDEFKNFVDSNQAGLDLLGYSKKEIINMNISNVDADSQEVLPAHELLQSGSKITNYEHRLKRKDGRIITVLNNSRPLTDSKGNFSGMLSTIIDISERKEAENFIKIQRELGLSLLSAKSMGKILEICLETAINISGMEGGGIYLIDKVKGINLAVSKGLSSEFISNVKYYEYDLHIPNVKLIMAGKPFYFNSEQLQGTLKKALPDAEVQMLAVIPILFEKKIIACFNLLSHSINELPDFVKTALETISTQIGAAISRAKVEEELNQTNVFLDTIIENLPNMLFIKEAKELRFIRFNKAGEELLGYSSEELIGKNDYDFFPKKEAEFFTEKDRNVLKTKQYIDIHEETIHTRKKGIRVLHTQKIPILDQNGKSQYLLGISEDITYRKEAENRLIEKEKELRLITDSTLDIIFTLTKTGKILYINSAVKKLMGYEPEDIFGTFFKKLVPIKELSKYWKGLKEVFRNKTVTGFRTYVKHKNGHQIPVEISGTLIKKDRKYVILGAIRDISERLKAEQELKLSEERFQVLSNATFESIFISERGICLNQNQTAERMFGYKLDEAIGKQGTDWIVPEDRKLVIQNMMKGYEKAYEVIALRKDGSTFLCEIQGKVMEYQGKQVRITALRDITEKQKAVEALKLAHEDLETRVIERTRELQASESKWRSLVENAPDLILTADRSGIILSINRTITNRSIEEIPGLSLYDFVSEEDKLKIQEAIENVFKTGKAGSYEVSGVGAGGSLAWYSTRVGPVIQDGYVKSVILISSDITERKKIEEALSESEELFRNLSNNSPNMIFINSGGKVVYANNKCVEIMGYKREELYNDNFDFFTLIAPESIEKVKQEYKSHLLNKEILPFDYTIITKKGKKIDIMMSSKLISFKGRQSILGILADITERNQAAKQIKSSLHEKEALLKEIHHRVKNNLQVVASLLNLQSRYIKDDQAVEQIVESRNRVYSMALVHENLYQSETLAEVDVASYISALTTNIFHSYGIDNSDIELEINAKNIYLKIDQAIPCGLIINELLSNSLKHAFPNRNNLKKVLKKDKLKKNKIKIEFTMYKEKIKFSFMDNGVGLPENIDLNSKKTLGLRLLNNLVKQLDGILKVNMRPLTCFTIEFNKVNINEEKDNE